ncbi:MAG: FAD-dependent oxidoreductase [Prolixibacteraceae bacterium]|nr:FAD-dependent oxidoreductase [Prolixibacteraceae bacterium]MBN2775124.1 FAD-dependent oxidoreductase [Prolixibacteraceae bacterium]
MKKCFFFSIIFLTLVSCIDNNKSENPINQSIVTDVCIYTATPSGILAAIAVKEAGHSVVIVEPGKWVGGILGAGIKPIQDCPNFAAIGGKTRELMKILGTGKINNEISERELRRISSLMSPKQIRDDFLRILNEYDIQVIYDHRINLCNKVNGKIIETIYDYAPFDETGCPVAEPARDLDLRVNAKVYIDASYDGELMARSGVSFMTGRESEYDFSEKNAGVCEPTNVTPIDPFNEKGNPESGLLPMVEDDLNYKVGVGDYYTQAYNFRYYVTSEPKYKLEFNKPQNYNPIDFELIGRYIEYLKKNTNDQNELIEKLSGIFPGWMNEGEYNYQRGSLFTMAPVGVSHLYANGDYGTKAQIWKYHQDYLSGLHYFMCTDNRVPEKYREEIEGLGLDKRHHPETQGWPHQLYIRISRRLVGNYIITSHDVYNETIVDDPIGLAQYGIDTYPARRIWFQKNGKDYVGLEGNMFVGGANGPTNVPYPVSYRAITPKENECINLLVPICFSATHLGYASARMEPVFMICGESAGLAAVQAIEENKCVQDISYTILKEKLLENNLILSATQIK